jgi:hypothetical protein
MSHVLGRLAARTLLAGLLALGLAGASLARPPVAAVSPQLHAFVSRVLDHLNGSGELLPGDVDPAYERLLDENHTLAGDRLGRDDFHADPICQCFEEGGRYSLVSLTAQGERAQARIRLRGGEAPGIYTLVLERTDRGGWRIRDALNGGGSTRATAERHNACLRRLHGEAAILRCFGDD